MKSIADPRPTIADPEAERLRKIYELGHMMGRLISARRKNRKAIQQNLDGARALGVRIDVKASEL